MNHRQIDERAVAERYVKHALSSAERAAFEAHLVDCQECVDRLLLAQMFHARNGHATVPAESPPPLRLVRVGWQNAVTFFALAVLAATLVCALAAHFLSAR